MEIVKRDLVTDKYFVKRLPLMKAVSQMDKSKCVKSFLNTQVNKSYFPKDMWFFSDPDEKFFYYHIINPDRLLKYGMAGCAIIQADNWIDYDDSEEKDVYLEFSEKYYSENQARKYLDSRSIFKTIFFEISLNSYSDWYINPLMLKSKIFKNKFVKELKKCTNTEFNRLTKAIFSDPLLDKYFPELVKEYLDIISRVKILRSLT
ncbi:MAG: hypothetical protein QXW35_04430 [Candidatus Aenigmatarchaeota archaeon]